MSDIASELEALSNTNACIIFMDRLETSPSLVKGLLQSGKRVVTFDDYGSGRVHADLAISAIFDDVEISNNFCSGRIIVCKSMIRILYTCIYCQYSSNPNTNVCKIKNTYISII